MGQNAQFPKFNVRTAHSIELRDIEDSPKKLGDLSLSDSYGGDGGGHVRNSNEGGGTGGIANEEEESW